METVIVVPAPTLPGASTIDVYAQNLMDHKVYSVYFYFFDGAQGSMADAFLVYPNPAVDKVYISVAPHSLVALYSAMGECVRKTDDFTGTSFRLTGLENGGYTLRVVRSDGGVAVKKLILS